MSPRVLCLWIPNWPIQRRVLQDPALAGQAVAVHAANARQGRRLIACSDPAERLGLRPAMPLSEAAMLRRRSAVPLHLTPHDAVGDLQQLSLLAEHCERFSPLTGWRTTEDTNMSPETGPDCLLLDVSNLSRHFGGESELVRRACESLGRRGVSVCAGMADTIGAAWAAAHFDSQGQLAGDSHCWIIDAQSHISALQPLPPVALRLSPATLSLLEQLGLATIDQLRQLPRSAVASRLGDEFLRRMDQVFGNAAETILAHRPTAEFSVECRFETPVRDRRFIERAAQEMAATLAGQLREARRRAIQIDCRLDSLQGQTTHLTIGLFEPSMDADHLSELLCLQLETAQLENGVERLSLTAPQVAIQEQRQGDLFGQHQNLQAAAQLVDRLRQRLGQKQVLQPHLRSDAQPERAFAYVARPIAARRRPTTSEAASRLDGQQQTLPLHRPVAVSQPQELSVFSWHDDMPREFSWNGKLVELLRYWGPERIETGWWRGHSVRRDYYRVELRGGERLWIFCQLNTKQWYLHGWYC